MTIEIAIFSAVIIGVLAGLLLENIRRRIDPAADAPPLAKATAGAPLRLTGPGGASLGDPTARAVDSATALRLVSDAGFASRPLLTGREADVLAAVESIAAEAGLGWRVVPQVRLNDILASADEDANAVIGDHRLDMLVVSASRMPVAAVDYQPMGQLRDDAALNDAVKREALRRADIPYIEIRANEPIDTLRAQLLRLAAPVPVTRSRAAPKVPAAAKVVTAKVVAARVVTRPAARRPARAAAPAVRTPAKPAAKPATAPPAATVPAKAPAAKAAKPAAPKPAKPVEAQATTAAAKPATKAPAKAAKPAKAAPKRKPGAKDPPAEP